jgi:hypothetical protein
MKNNCFSQIYNIDDYRDFINEIVKGVKYPIYMNGKRIDKRKIINKNNIDDAEDWFDNNIPVMYIINNKEIHIFVGNKHIGEI